MKSNVTACLRFLVFFFCLFCIILPAISQQQTALSGKVTDARSQPVANATIHILNTNKQIITGQDGSFSFTNLKPGRYQLEITAIGFTTGNRDLSVKSGGETISILLADAARR